MKHSAHYITPQGALDAYFGEETPDFTRFGIMGTLVSMTIIPNFILKRMYREGSFRRLEGGVGFDIINNLGPGQLSKINGITLNGVTYDATQIELIWNEERLPAEAITESEPATFFLNQVITCVIRDEAVAEGAYQITLDLISREAGKVVLTVKDSLKAA